MNGAAKTVRAPKIKCVDFFTGTKESSNALLFHRHRSNQRFKIDGAAKGQNQRRAVKMFGPRKSNYIEVFTET